MFGDHFLESLPTDRFERARAVCAQFRRMNDGIDEGEETDHYPEYIDALALLTLIIDESEFEVTIPRMDGDKYADIEAIQELYSLIEMTIEQIAATNQLETSKERFAAQLRHGFFYEFSSGDLTRVQQLTNELRDLITKSEQLDDDHRGRLLKRLERFQRELHKRVSDLDRFWGLVGDAGVVLYKLGHDSKPIVDRMREIAEIVWRTQARAEELPSGIPFSLPTGSSSEEE